MSHWKIDVQIAYILVTKAGVARPEQERMLGEVGITSVGEDDPVYVDDITDRRRSRGSEDLRARAMLVRAIRPGDEIVVATPGCLGLSGSDILTIIREIGAKGGYVRVAATGDLVRWHPDAIAVLQFCDEAGAEVSAARTSRMRKSLATAGTKTGPRAAPISAHVRALWTGTNTPVAEIAREAGLTSRTLYRRLGHLARPKPGN